MSLLSLEQVTAFYGPSQALFDVSLEVAEGEVLALMGRNGMGKTTTIRTICRMLRHRGGRIAFDGCDIAALPSYRVAQMGVGLVPEGQHAPETGILPAWPNFFRDWRSAGARRPRLCQGASSKCWRSGAR
jgi:ABC-type branched-subunit amino acid transport system ATPase component